MATIATKRTWVKSIFIFDLSLNSIRQEIYGGRGGFTSNVNVRIIN